MCIRDRVWTAYNKKWCDANFKKSSIDFFDELVKAWSAPSFAGKFLQKAARAPVLFHSNTFITILSSCVILPIKVQKQVVIPKDIILKAKANIYQQNQTILPYM